MRRIKQATSRDEPTTVFDAYDAAVKLHDYKPLVDLVRCGQRRRRPAVPGMRTAVLATRRCARSVRATSPYRSVIAPAHLSLVARPAAPAEAALRRSRAAACCLSASFHCVLPLPRFFCPPHSPSLSSPPPASGYVSCNHAVARSTRVVVEAHRQRRAVEHPLHRDERGKRCNANVHCQKCRRCCCRWRRRCPCRHQQQAASQGQLRSSRRRLTRWLVGVVGGHRRGARRQSVAAAAADEEEPAGRTQQAEGGKSSARAQRWLQC